MEKKKNKYYLYDSCRGGFSIIAESDEQAIEKMEDIFKNTPAVVNTFYDTDGNPTKDKRIIYLSRLNDKGITTKMIYYKFD